MAVGAGRSTEDAKTPRHHQRSRAAGHGHQPELRAGRGRQLQPAQPGDRRALVLLATRRWPASWSPPRSRATRGRPGEPRPCPPPPSTSPATATPPRTATPACRSSTAPRPSGGPIDLPPFKAAIEAGVDSIMTAHIQVPSLDPSGVPATLSKPIMTGLLRDELGYNGVIVTDSLGMDGVRNDARRTRDPGDGARGRRRPAADAAEPAARARRGARRRGQRPAHREAHRPERAADPEAQVQARHPDLKPFVDEDAGREEVGTPDEPRRRSSRSATARTTVLRNDAGLLPFAGNPGKVLVTGVGDTPTPRDGPPSRVDRAQALRRTALPTGTSPTPTTSRRRSRRRTASDLVIVLTNGLRTSANAAQPGERAARHRQAGGRGRRADAVRRGLRGRADLDRHLRLARRRRWSRWPR